MIEGQRAVLDVFDTDAQVQEVFVTEELAGGPIAERARSADIPVHLVSPAVAKAISGSVTPQGVVLVAASPLRPLGTVQVEKGLVVILSAVSDPGNVGTLVRTAAAAGADAVILTEGSADVLNPKTARSSAAALFSVPLVVDVTLSDAIDHVRGLGCAIVGADARSNEDLYSADLISPIAMVLGNESWGVSDADASLLDRSLSIPMPGRAESLNVAVAGSVILFEALRQRREAGGARVSSGGPKEARA